MPALVQGGLVLGHEKRRELAKAVVDAGIDIYVNGRVNDFLPLQTLGGYLPGSVTKYFQLSLGLPVKAMQFVGLRDDLPEGYRSWFSKAQEDTDFRSPESHVRQQLSSFADLRWDAEPVKSASIAQVHLAEWRGKPAVAKVQHQHVREEFRTDLNIMSELGKYVDKHEEARGVKIILSALAEKLLPTVEAETNFAKEAANQGRIRQAFAGSGVYVAEVYEATLMALVMERLQGKTASEAEKAWKEGERLDLFGRQQRDQIYEAYAKMVLQDHFFQMDAHAGNFMALGGSVALLDFGQCCEVTPAQRELFEHFAANAPTSPEEAKDAERLKGWLNGMGVTVTAQQAPDAAALLFFGAKSTMFPRTGGINPEMTPLLLVVHYLSRFENTAAGLRAQVGLPDAADGFAVLRAFKNMPFSRGSKRHNPEL